MSEELNKLSLIYIKENPGRIVRRSPPCDDRILDDFVEWMAPLALQTLEKKQKSPIAQIGNCDVDLSKIAMVSEIGGDTNWLRYTVYFMGGVSLEIYENRKHILNSETLQMPRQEFIKLWKSWEGLNERTN